VQQNSSLNNKAVATILEEDSVEVVVVDDLETASVVGAEDSVTVKAETEEAVEADEVDAMVTRRTGFLLLNWDVWFRPEK
jgi:hypothetical protein